MNNGQGRITWNVLVSESWEKKKISFRFPLITVSDLLHIIRSVFISLMMHNLRAFEVSFTESLFRLCRGEKAGEMLPEIFLHHVCQTLAAQLRRSQLRWVQFTRGKSGVTFSIALFLSRSNFLFRLWETLESNQHSEDGETWNRRTWSTWSSEVVLATLPAVLFSYTYLPQLEEPWPRWSAVQFCRWTLRTGSDPRPAQMSTV